MKTILISGASGGIGSALALAYAADSVHLILTARNEIKLKALAAQCEAKGAQVTIYADDLLNDSFVRWVKQLAQENCPDIVIANAGITSTIGPSDENESISAVTQVMQTNFLGVIRLVRPIVAKMQQQKQGQVAIISSIAAVVSLPQSPAYCASKAALNRYIESLALLLRPDNVRFTLVLPGFIKTALSDKLQCNKPLMITPDKAARKIKRAISKKKAMLIFPRALYYFSLLARCFPKWLVLKVLMAKQVATKDSYLGGDID